MTSTPHSRSQRLARRIAAAVACLALAPPVLALAPGDAAPELALPGVKDAVQLAALKGRVVYVDFWASWCGPCKQSFPFMNELQARHAARGLTVLAVNLDAKREDADRFLAQVPAQFTLAFDAKGESARRFEVKGMPSSLVVGRDGRITAVHRGFRPEDREAIEQHITTALAAKP